MKYTFNNHNSLHLTTRKTFHNAVLNLISVLDCKMNNGELIGEYDKFNVDYNDRYDIVKFEFIRNKNVFNNGYKLIIQIMRVNNNIKVSFINRSTLNIYEACDYYSEIIKYIYKVFENLYCYNVN